MCMEVEESQTAGGLGARTQERYLPPCLLHCAPEVLQMLTPKYPAPSSKQFPLLSREASWALNELRGTEACKDGGSWKQTSRYQIPIYIRLCCEEKLVISVYLRVVNYIPIWNVITQFRQFFPLQYTPASRQHDTRPLRNHGGSQFGP